ncbi:hypothetical protein [Pseudomonas siliginis]|uniref:hypothetical protein n=1 Tax=Pseudomonas siliginis TaxID=2842346 RepID=UPI002092DD89|nr:hypothetical protein [Pseudomonas siliginis]UST77165.1 hypothetical protein NF676_00425 [Pseudomonas siliginis]
MQHVDLASDGYSAAGSAAPSACGIVELGGEGLTAARWPPTPQAESLAPPGHPRCRPFMPIAQIRRTPREQIRISTGRAEQRRPRASATGSAAPSARGIVELGGKDRHALATGAAGGNPGLARAPSLPTIRADQRQGQA